MIEIDRLSLTLPAALDGRAEAVTRAAVDALAARAAAGPIPERRLNALPGLEVQADAGWSDAELGGAIAHAVWTAAARGEGGG